ncbi:MAG: hypothetical protein AAF567_02500 [Actinomycetota bacterium]
MTAVYLAPRELYDYALRIARVDGFDPAAASILADAVVGAAAAGHDGAGLFFDLLDSTTICDVLLAIDAIAAGEVEARSGVTASVVVDPPVPDAMLLAALAEAERRGVERIASSSVDGRTTAVTLASCEPRATRASGRALELTAERYAELDRRASLFLVSEAALDALLD